MGILTFMKYNLKLSSFLGLTPMYNMKHDKLTYHPVYSYLTAIFIISASSYNTYQHIIWGIWNVTDLAFTLLDFTSVFYILSSYHCRHMTSMVRALEQFDLKAKRTGLTLKVNNLIFLHVILFVVLNIWFLYNEIKHFTGFGTMYTFLIANYYWNGMAVLCSLLRAILGRLQLVNLYLDVKAEVKEDIGTFLSLHDSGCSIVGTFNKCFGWHILLYMLCGLMFSLQTVRGAVTANNFDYKLEKLFYMAFLLGSSSILVVYGEQVKAEMQRSISKARSLARFLVRRMDATLLVQQTALCGSCVNAAGFFNLDHSAIFLFANLIISNVVVIIQLNADTHLKGHSCCCNCTY